MVKTAPPPLALFPTPKKLFFWSVWRVSVAVWRTWCRKAESARRKAHASSIYSIPLDGIKTPRIVLIRGVSVLPGTQTPGTVSASLMTVKGHNKSFREGEGEHEGEREDPFPGRL